MNSVDFKKIHIPLAKLPRLTEFLIWKTPVRLKIVFRFRKVHCIPQLIILYALKIETLRRKSRAIEQDLNTSQSVNNHNCNDL